MRDSREHDEHGEYTDASPDSMDLLVVVPVGVVLATAVHLTAMMLITRFVILDRDSPAHWWYAVFTLVAIDSVLLVLGLRKAGRSSGNGLWLWTAFTVTLSLFMLIGGMCLAPVGWV
jgi:hypothetical protein